MNQSTLIHHLCVIGDMMKNLSIVYFLLALVLVFGQTACNHTPGPEVSYNYFDNFGRADSNNSNDLTKLNGIGPYIEQKLNEIGIYNYDQISRFNQVDINVITELIDFFPGRIERDNWIGQANSLKDSSKV